MRVNKQVDPPALARTTPDVRLRPIPYGAHAGRSLQKEGHFVSDTRRNSVGTTASHQRDGRGTND